MLVVESFWSIYFDRVAHHDEASIGVIFYIFQAEILLYSFTLTCRCSKNMTEYQTLMLGLEMAVDMKQLYLKVYGDFKLVVNQFFEIYEVKKPELVPYHNYARQLMDYLDDMTIEYVPRRFNRQVD